MGKKHRTIANHRGSIGLAYDELRSQDQQIGLDYRDVFLSLTANDIGNDIENGSGTSRTYTAPTGYFYSSVTVDLGADFTADNVCSGKTIFGRTGSATCGGTSSNPFSSNALRDAGVSVVSILPTQSASSQLTLSAELSTYAELPLPTTGGYNYREIPDETKDDDGYTGITCKYAPRPSNDCGKTQATIALRIADCASQNPTTATWDGATQCSQGQSTWKLVTRSGANKEVWQDQRTGFVWSSQVNTSTNWCQASGNQNPAPVTFAQAYNNAARTPITGNGMVSGISGGTSSLDESITITFTAATTFSVSGTGGAGGCQGGSITAGGLTGAAGSTVTWSRANICSFTLTQGTTPFANTDKIILRSTDAALYSCSPGAGSGMQPASPVSYCAEAAGVNAPAGEVWGAGTYLAAKGGMGKNSTPSIRWRLPTIEDYKLADIDGIRMVMPDAGILGTNRPTIDGSPGGNIEWTSISVSNFREMGWHFSSYTGYMSAFPRGSASGVRCLGR